MIEAKANPVLVVGLAGVNWTDLVARLTAQTLPILASVLRSGAAGPLVAPGPVVGAARWATLVTGLSATDHGVITPTEPWAGGLRPTSAASWRVAPLWARLAQAGLRTGSVGWPASRPGAHWPGDHVDDGFAIANGMTWNDWAMAPDAVPPALREDLRAVRMHPHDVTGDMLAPFVPALASIDQTRDHRLVTLAIALARLSSEHAAALELLGSQSYEAFFVQHDWLSDITRTFAGAAPPYAGVVNAAWTLLDQLIGRLLTVAADRTVLLAGLGEGGEPGVLIAAGPTIAPGKIAGATLADLAPTILRCLGLADPTLPGRALLPGPSTSRSLPPAAPPHAAPPHNADDLARVAALGLRPPVAKAAMQARHLGVQAEALLLSDTAAARRLAEEALALAPDDVLPLGVLAAASVLANEVELLEPLADRLTALAPDHPWLPLIEGARHVLRGDASAARPHLTLVEQGDRPDLTLRAGMLWLTAARPSDAERCARRVLSARPGHVDALVLLARSLAMHPAEAEATWKSVLALDPASPIAREGLGHLLRRLGRSHEADALEAAG
ncbi:MAG: alkaline phosphatase family protein [Sphingomonadales bacterium]|nr:alkaline phosphatase family protein [Sphingomonadales bacterium]